MLHSHERGDDRPGSAAQRRAVTRRARPSGWCPALDGDAHRRRSGRSDVRDAAADPRRGAGRRWTSRRSRSRPVSLARLAEARSNTPWGEAIDWTRLRAALDELTMHPEAAQAAIATPPPRSGSARLDALLAGIAEKLADDAGLPRPSWCRTVPALAEPWQPPGTPWMVARAAASAPEQLRRRNIFLGESELWRRPLESAGVSAPLFDRTTILTHLEELNTRARQARHEPCRAAGRRWELPRVARPAERHARHRHGSSSRRRRQACGGRDRRTASAVTAVAERRVEGVPARRLRRRTWRRGGGAFAPDRPRAAPRRRVRHEAPCEPRRRRPGRHDPAVADVLVPIGVRSGRPVRDRVPAARSTTRSWRSTSPSTSSPAPRRDMWLNADYFRTPRLLTHVPSPLVELHRSPLHTKEMP